MPNDRIADYEILYRRIRPGKDWFEPPDRPTSANFKLKRLEDNQYEEGLSVYRGLIVSAAEVLAKPEAEPESRAAQAFAGEIRALKNGEEKSLQLDVVAVADQSDPGHAEIRGPEPRKLPPSAPRRLAKLFRVVET